MNDGLWDELADIATAFLIGAALGVAATLLLRDESASRKRSGLARLRRRRSLERDLRSALAALRNR